MEQAKINFVQALSIETRAEVIYLYLNEGKSHRKIEEAVPSLKPSRGWQAWAVLHYYGFTKDFNAKYPHLTRNQIIRNLNGLNEEYFSERPVPWLKLKAFARIVNYFLDSGRFCFGFFNSFWCKVI